MGVGGGGNFGVVTAMHHRLHDLPSVRSGMLIYPFVEARAVLGRCIDVMTSMPEELPCNGSLWLARTAHRWS